MSGSTAGGPAAAPGPPSPEGDGQEDRAAEVAWLLAGHPRWAVWVPGSDGRWTAVRPAGSQPPAPGTPMLWASAGTAGELGSRMDALDEQASGGGWPGPERDAR